MMSILFSSFIKQGQLSSLIRVNHNDRPITSKTNDKQHSTACDNQKWRACLSFWAMKRIYQIAKGMSAYKAAGFWLDAGLKKIARPTESVARAIMSNGSSFCVFIGERESADETSDNIYR